jgi:hypothetical protein
MLEVASALARDVDSVRVDLYSSPTRVNFGATTNYPEAGGGARQPESALAALGYRWRPERHYGPKYRARRIKAEQVQARWRQTHDTCRRRRRKTRRSRICFDAGDGSADTGLRKVPS